MKTQTMLTSKQIETMNTTNNTIASTFNQFSKFQLATAEKAVVKGGNDIINEDVLEI